MVVQRYQKRYPLQWLVNLAERRLWGNQISESCRVEDNRPVGFVSGDARFFAGIVLQ